MSSCKRIFLEFSHFPRWDRYPLQLGAQADIVIIDGQVIDNFNLPSIPRPSQTQSSLVPTGPTACSNTPNAYLVTGVNVSVILNFFLILWIYTMNATDAIIANASILVDATGIVRCIGTCTATPGADVYTSVGGIVIPGVISVGANVGTWKYLRNAPDR
jgi:hypothetical protein